MSGRAAKLVRRWKRSLEALGAKDVKERELKRCFNGLSHGEKGNLRLGVRANEREVARRRTS